MPATTQRMFRAMQAAKSGHSNLGIPAKVGAEFVAATPNPSELPEEKGEPRKGHAREERKEHRGGRQFDLKKRGHGLQRANR